MKSFPVLALGAVLGAALALPAVASPADDRDARQALTESSCSLSTAVELALGAVPGDATKARLKRSRKPGQEPVWFYKVVVFDESSERNALRFDARSCEALALTPPEIPLDDAIDTALLELGGGIPVAGRLHFPGLEPVYRVAVLGPRVRWVVLVDGVSGEVLAVRRWKRRLDEALDHAGEEAEDSSL